MIFCSLLSAQNKKTYLAKVELNGKYGYIDTSGKEVIPVIYDDAGSHNDSDGLVSWGNNLIPVNIGKYNPKIETPKLMVKGSETNGTTTSHSPSEIAQKEKEKGKWGYCNAQGILAIPAQFTDAGPFSEGRAAVKTGDKWGYIDTAGKIMIPAAYEEAGYFSEGLALAKKDGLYGYINTKGEEVLKFQYEYAYPFQNGYARVSQKHQSKDDRKNMINRTINKEGKMITPEKYDLGSDFSNDLAVFSLSDIEPHSMIKYGIINTKGEVLAPPVYNEISTYSEGMAKVMVYKRRKGDDERYPVHGYIDTQGKEIVKPSFAVAEDFHQGTAVVSLDDDLDNGWFKTGLIDKKGKTILDFKWMYLQRIGNTCLGVNSNWFRAASIATENKSIIDSKGKAANITINNSLNYLGENLFLSTNEEDEPIAIINLDQKTSTALHKTEGKKSECSQLGTIQFSEKCKDCEEWDARLHGLMDLKGNIIVDAKYDRISVFEPVDN